MLKNWPIPTVIAHRGASKFAPENTLAAFELAIDMGADAIEFDVKLTADREVVVIHDSTVDRTTNGSGKVSGLSLVELQQLDAGIKFNESFKYEKIPSLREVFQQLGNRIKMNIEFTNYSTPFDDLVDEVDKLIREFDLRETILFSSFYSWNLKKARKIIPEIPCGLLAFPGWLGFNARNNTSKKGFQALHPNRKDIDDHLISKCHAIGNRIHVWTVNNEEEMRVLLRMGVDGLFTDDPELLSSTLNKLN